MISHYQDDEEVNIIDENTIDKIYFISNITHCIGLATILYFTFAY
jgi:hypothetical protein